MELTEEQKRELEYDNRAMYECGRETSQFLTNTGLDPETATRLVLAMRQVAIENMLKAYPGLTPTQEDINLIKSVWGFLGKDSQ
jgi:hypothetical protein